MGWEITDFSRLPNIVVIYLASHVSTFELVKMDFYFIRLALKYIG